VFPSGTALGREAGVSENLCLVIHRLLVASGDVAFAVRTVKQRRSGLAGFCVGGGRRFVFGLSRPAGADETAAWLPGGLAACRPDSHYAVFDFAGVFEPKLAAIHAGVVILRLHLCI